MWLCVCVLAFVCVQDGDEEMPCLYRLFCLFVSDHFLLILHRKKKDVSEMKCACLHLFSVSLLN